MLAPILHRAREEREYQQCRDRPEPLVSGCLRLFQRRCLGINAAPVDDGYIPVVRTATAAVVHVLRYLPSSLTATVPLFSVAQSEPARVSITVSRFVADHHPPLARCSQAKKSPRYSSNSASPTSSPYQTARSDAGNPQSNSTARHDSFECAAKAKRGRWSRVSTSAAPHRWCSSNAPASSSPAMQSETRFTISGCRSSQSSATAAT